MEKIAVAIGGGDIFGWNFKTKDDKTFEYNLRKVDEYIRNLSKKETPKLLFIGTASKENPYYFNAIKNIYENLGCICVNLNIIDNENKDDIYSKVLDADIIYIGGGNTKYMLSEWERVDLKKAILDAYNKGIIIAGYSAGAYALFNSNYENIDGFNIIDAISIVHFNEKSIEKKNMFFDKIKNAKKLGIALDNSVALVYKDSKMSIVKDVEDAKGYKYTYINDNIEKEEI